MLRQFARQLSKTIDLKFVPQKRCIAISKKLFADHSVTAAAAVETPTAEAAAENVKEVPKPTVLVDKCKNITLIGINRPAQRNAIDPATASLLCDAFNNFEADETSPVAVLYGVGGAFCAGFDIFELANEGKERVSIELLMMQEGSVGPTRRILKKPVVCGINGYCIANGLELALMCDLRVMEESAVLGFFNRRFGVPVIDGGTVRLPAMIGFSRAMDLILTGRPIGAKEAYDIGIANRIVSTGESFEKALELATTLSKFPQSALNHDRNSLYSSVFESTNFNQAIQNEIMYTSKDIISQMQDGIKWFNKTFSADSTSRWLKEEKSMADWDSDEVATAAATLEEQKQAAETARIEAEKKEKKEKTKKKSVATVNVKATGADEVPPASTPLEKNEELKSK